jgi:hypothetical protein
MDSNGSGQRAQREIFDPRRRRGGAMSFDFGALERLWLTSIEEALTSIEFGRGGRLYAIAFWLFYREYGSVIHPPMVGLGEETAWQKEWGSEGRDAGFASGRWSPADWKYDILMLPRADAIEAAYTTLATEACGMDPEEARDAHDDPKRDARWESYFARSIGSVIAVSRELTRRARARIGVFAALPLTDDFVTVVCDPSQGKDGEQWLRRCVDEPLFSTLFPNLS